MCVCMCVCARVCVCVCVCLCLRKKELRGRGKVTKMHTLKFTEMYVLKEVLICHSLFSKALKLG